MAVGGGGGCVLSSYHTIVDWGCEVGFRVEGSVFSGSYCRAEGRV